MSLKVGGGSLLGVLADIVLVVVIVLTLEFKENKEQEDDEKQSFVSL